MRRLRRCGRLATRQERRKVTERLLLPAGEGTDGSFRRIFRPKDMPSCSLSIAIGTSCCLKPSHRIRRSFFFAHHRYGIKQTNNLRINSVRTIAGKGLYTHSPVRHHAGLQRSRPLAPCAGLNTGASCVSRAYCRTFWRSAHHPAARGRVVVHAPRPV